ncbi:MAG TPA: carboxypeptidase regulatory-like domain-containing protein [Patescibacteria group bacterium]|nr:carboxypeptidase regulatory-like domain-containing protein [Patescibacteria group bacterium]
MRDIRRTWKGKAVLAVAAPALAVLAVAAIGGRGRAAGPPAEDYTVQAGPSGTIQGRVLYVGKPVRPVTMVNTEDPAYCGSTMVSYPIRVEKGGVVDAVVWIDHITHGKAFAFPKAVVNQKKCAFTPSVVLMAPGRLKVENSDPVAHDVQIFARLNPSSNHVMPKGSKPLELTMIRPETVTVACDIHKDMTSYVVIAQNPYYALTRSGGVFELTGVPPGTYQIKVWQKKLGTRTERVTVRAGKTSNVTFKLGA